jgi:hypothetical protein
MSEIEFFNLATLVVCLIVIYMTLHMILSTPVVSYNFKSGVRLASLLGCTGIFIFGAVMLVDELRFSRGGVVANAVIKDRISEVQATLTQGSKATYKVRYEFNDQNNVSYQGIAEVDKYIWDMSQLNPDRKLKIVYMNDNPSLSRNFDKANWSQALLFLAIGLSGLMFSLLKKNKFIYYHSRYVEPKDGELDRVTSILMPYSEGSLRRRNRT